ncbi:MAG: prephenate dehydratase [Opitutae bacterium]|jgi:chorismate mutase/prephenate dehydratase|nr:prephenate dehydratase [Opitutae bacterium]
MSKENLDKQREQIDKIDAGIVQSLNQRLTIAHEIGKIKQESGADFYDPAREAEVFKKLSNLNEGPLNQSALNAIYREVISASIALEKDLQVAFLGPEATYTHQAVLKNFGVSLKATPMKTISDVFSAVEAGDCDYGVVPIENSTEGAVFHSMDELVESDLKICAQVYLPIEHCLISQSPLSEIKEVHSKDQALGQCREWLRRNLPNAELVESHSTASAVEIAAKRPEVAAIASSIAAELNDVAIVQNGIQDNSENVTRFLVIGKTDVRSLGDGKDKTSLVISLKDQSGALEKALMPFAKRSINLSKIESRPSRKKAWDYFFFVDLIGHIEEASVQAAIEELKECSSFVKWLGSYPNV